MTVGHKGRSTRPGELDAEGDGQAGKGQLLHQQGV